jgi:hypothetical protein
MLYKSEQKNNFFELKNFAKKYLQKHLESGLGMIVPEPTLEDFGLIKWQDSFYEVRVSSPVPYAKDNRSTVWDFDLRGNKWVNGRNVKIERTQTLCNFYLLIGLRENKPFKIFLLPAEKAPPSHVRITLTGRSKYYQYEI